MRNIFIFALCLFVIAGSATPPLKGGYLGRRFIIGTELSYSPNYTSVKDVLLSYNLQYGGNVHFVTGRYSQLGFSYNIYSLGAHNRYNSDLSDDGKIKGYQIGMTYRKFRKKKGGLAPIGKFIDMSLNYHADEYSVAYETIIPLVPVVVNSKTFSASVGFGSQGIFWDRVVANAGVRVGSPMYTFGLEKEGTGYISGGEASYMQKRLQYKDYFSVFFGVGIIL